MAFCRICLTVSCEYDDVDRVSVVRYVDTLMYAYHYDGEGNLQRITIKWEFVLGGLSAPASTSLNYQWSKSMTTTDFHFN